VARAGAELLAELEQQRRARAAAELREQEAAEEAAAARAQLNHTEQQRVAVEAAGAVLVQEREVAVARAAAAEAAHATAAATLATQEAAAEVAGAEAEAECVGLREQVSWPQHCSWPSLLSRVLAWRGASRAVLSWCVCGGQVTGAREALRLERERMALLRARTDGLEHGVRDHAAIIFSG
jgi:fused signal recognition particle receptor